MNEARDFLSCEVEASTLKLQLKLCNFKNTLLEMTNTLFRSIKKEEAAKIASDWREVLYVVLVINNSRHKCEMILRRSQPLPNQF